MAETRLPIFSQSRQTLQAQVHGVLANRKWHCRGHEYPNIQTGQLAGGGGIQGLQRGSKTRPGLVIESQNQHCATCRKTTRWDRWTGRQTRGNAPASIPQHLQRRVQEFYGFKDTVEGRKRPAHELVIDHRFPMIRWAATEPRLSSEMPESEIMKKFQLLKADRSGNHNLLKSRVCESCLRGGQRGTPFGILWFYKGGIRWPHGVPTRGPRAEDGCKGCGWYNFDQWRQSLNAAIALAGSRRR
jgi:hypothetical protein